MSSATLQQGLAQLIVNAFTKNEANAKITPYRMIARINCAVRMLMVGHAKIKPRQADADVDLLTTINELAKIKDLEAFRGQLMVLATALEKYTLHLNSVNCPEEEIQEQTQIGEREAKYILNKHSKKFADKLLLEKDLLPEVAQHDGRKKAKKYVAIPILFIIGALMVFGMVHKSLTIQDHSSSRDELIEQQRIDSERERMLMSHEEIENQRTKDRNRQRGFVIMMGLVACIVIGNNLYRLPYFEKRSYAALKKSYSEQGRIDYRDVHRFIEKYPKNAHCEEVIMMWARTANNKKDISQLNEAIIVYLERYPDGQYAEECRQYYDIIVEDGIN